MPPRSEIVAHYHRALREALMNHLEAQVPVGLMLSGGIDSTLLLALWRASFPGAHIHTFTVVSREGRDSDAHYARQAAQQFESVHHEIELGPEVMADLPAWWGAQDQPQADPAAFLTARLCARASGQVKALLSGAGADETLAGYRRHWAFAQYARFPRFWRALAFVGVARLLRLPLWQKMGFAQEVARFLDKLVPSPAQTFVRFTYLHWEGEALPSFGAAPEPSDIFGFCPAT
ncbi:MAG: asparagine synthase [Microscillaceae bacterium]|nr:asparagine synthase [Microscillaceae bacterium]